MNITKLVIYKNNRLSLLSQDKISIYPNKTILILIGQGGFGKSTILGELSPLPADLKEYSKSGYKIIYITHNDKEYRLESIGDTNKHHFYVNNVNLNVSGNKKEQLYLVNQHFNVTPTLIEILLGTSTFTTMTTNERKKWFIEASNMDFTYSLSVFNKLRNRATELKSNIKLLNSKLSTEKSTKISETAVKQLHTELKVSYKLMELFLDKKKTMNDATIGDMDLNIPLKEMYNIINKLSTKRNLTEIGIRETTVRSIISHMNDEVKQHHMDMDNIIEMENTLKDGDLHILHTKLTRVNSYIKEIKNDMYIDIEVDDLVTTLSLLEDNYSIIGENLSNIDKKVIDNNTYSKHIESIASINKHLHEYKEKLDSLVSKDIQLNIDKEHMVTCSNCNNIIHVSYDAKTHNSIIKDIDIYSIKIDKMEKELLTKQSEVDIYLTNRRHINFIKNLCDTRYMGKVLTYVFTKYNIIDDKDIIMDSIFKITSDIKDWLAIIDLYKDMNKYKNNIAILNNNLDVNLSNKDNIKNKIIDITHKVNELKKELDMLDKDKRMLYKLRDAYNTYTSILNGMSTSNKHKLRVLKNKYINDSVFIIKEYITEIELKLNDNKYVGINIDKLEKEITLYSNKLDNVNTLIDTISPTDGIIAKSLNSTLNRFINHINTFIGKIWSYDLKVLPCDVDKNGLTYKFPVTVNDDIPRKDIIKCSSSQQEIINLGFKIIMMKHMGLENYPLYLDEFGRSFDITHLEEAYKTIDTLLEDNTVNQILMVSHFQHVYNRFPHATLVELTN